VNTRIHYIYRDESNCKLENDVVVAGEITTQEIEYLLDEDIYFIASQIGLEDIQCRWADRGFDFPTEHDHEFCEFMYLDPTEADPTINMTAETLKKNLQAASGRWDPRAARSTWPVFEQEHDTDENTRDYP